jgi:hypothetical protein
METTRQAEDGNQGKEQGRQGLTEGTHEEQHDQSEEAQAYRNKQQQKSEAESVNALDITPRKPVEYVDAFDDKPPTCGKILSATDAKAVRDNLFALAILVSKLASIVVAEFPADIVGVRDETKQPSPRFVAMLTQVWVALLKAASDVSLFVPECTMKKIHLNNKKYPVNLCQVRR